MKNMSPQDFANEIQRQIRQLQEDVQSLPWYSSFRVEEIQTKIMRKRSILIALEQSDGVKPSLESEPPENMNEAIRRNVQAPKT